MSFASYSSTPAANVTCNGINIAENCAAANINNVCRQLMSDGRELYDTVAAINVSSYMPVLGGYFTGNIARSGAGHYLYHATADRYGPVYVQQQASSLPSSPAEGTIVFTYA